MSDIKLRGFDRNDGKIKEIERIDLMNELVLFKDENGWVDGNNYELMQSTGIKDKNGKEIYESDILYIIEHHQATVFTNGRYDRTNNWDTETRYVVEFNPLCLQRVLHDHNFCEIIGNSYENPELLVH